MSSMATFAARRLQPMIANVAHILGIELAGGGAGHRLPAPAAQLGPLEQAHAVLRGELRGVMHDRYIAPDIEAASALVRDGSLARILRTLPGLPALWVAA